MSVRCDGCHRRTAPGARFCTGCRRSAKNRTLDAFSDDEEDEEKAITEEEAAAALRYALSHTGIGQEGPD